ncbi:WYL domain-containing protein (plasmid) [Paracoccus liaowanqingii]|uniref:WYL domain-containing protein n=1 Tax=Paracoccus liaowanqingii TaxID=2560053 RepID=A0A4Y5SR17_9RHOB|nr:WYL domain-containing protein [Paracoccus liaowanqingii]QDA35789.1 WYL domain-containing protein [Paracoccus liaowanqingii]
MKSKLLDARVLEYLAYWERQLTAGRLAAMMCVERQHSQSHMITPYETHPLTLGKLERHKRVKQFPALAGDGSLPAYTGTAPADALQILTALDFLTEGHRDTYREGWSSQVGPAVPLERVPVLNQLHASHEPFRTLFSACARRVAVTLRYRSRTSEAVHMTVSPHALIDGYQRPHFRCYVVEGMSENAMLTGRYLPGMKGKYWSDIVPYRVIEVEGEHPQSYVDGCGDSNWHQRSPLLFKLSDLLTPPLRDAVVQDYEGAEGFYYPYLLIPSVRVALTPYVRRSLRWRVFDNSHPQEMFVEVEGEERDSIIKTVFGMGGE